MSDPAVEKIIRLSADTTDLVTLWRGCGDVLRTAIPHFWTPCWYTLDPASLLITSHFHDGMPEFPPEWLAQEYLADDVNQLVDVATSETGVSTLHEATGGAPETSRRWHANMTLGGDQEMICRLRTGSGEVWGMLGLYRGPGEPMFGAADKELLRRAAPHLADAVRRALLMGEATEPDHREAPGLVILTERLELASTTDSAAAWLAELPDTDADAAAAGRLPAAVLAVAGRALRDGSGAFARVLSRNGRWVVLHGSPLRDGGERRVAVIVEAADPARIYPLLMEAYRLTPRERDVTRQVLQGASTAQIAAGLHLSAHTVQQHLKNIFDKTGVRSRRDLVGKVFFSHYEPRFRDNEKRVAAGRPVRGGPAVS